MSCDNFVSAYAQKTLWHGVHYEQGFILLNGGEELLIIHVIVLSF